MLTPAEIIRFDDALPPNGKSPLVDASRTRDPIRIAQSDAEWPGQFKRLSKLVRNALGQLALDVIHVGSTSVPGLPAKPIIDIDLVVPDSSEEAGWLPRLESAGFTLTIREPWWYEHRCLWHGDPKCNLHVFSPNCAEVARHQIFRDWLRKSPEDKEFYRDAKLKAAENTNNKGVEDYNARKQRVIREIYQRAFADAELV